MQFFAAGGDATEAFEFGEGVFDAVAFAIDVLVKGRRDGSSRVQGYDGDAAELVHISADGVAVVALVHDGVGAGAQMRLGQRLGLVESGDVRAGEDLGVTRSIARDTSTEAAELQRNADLNGHDLPMTVALRKSGITGIVTDDGDFCTVPSIRVFAANRTALKATGLRTK